MKNVGLILEGGGMRGVYTAGVLDAFIDTELDINYVIGVSSGANIGANYITKQKGRSKKIYLYWSQDKRFVGFRNLLKERSYFGMEFLFSILPNQLEKFDYDAFSKSDKVLVSCLTNCETGNVEYVEHQDYCPKSYMSTIIRASNSLPIISPPVTINNNKYLDGFLSDPLPIYKSIEDGNTHNIVVFTKKTGIETKVSWSDKLFRNITKIKYPKIGENIEKTVNEYFKRLKVVEELESKGKIFIFRPTSAKLENRYSKDVKELEAVYDEGYQDVIRQLEKLKKWLARITD